MNGTQHPTSTGDYISVEHNESSSADDDLVIEPEVGEITFALDITETYEPIDPAFVFSEGITEVHAIFEYRGMSSEDTWERVWYLNEQEVARTSGQWTDPESGVFNYFIDNGGEPLPAGDWILELYVNGKLRSLGVFIIDQN